LRQDNIVLWVKKRKENVRKLRGSMEDMEAWTVLACPLRFCAFCQEECRCECYHPCRNDCVEHCTHTRPARHVLTRMPKSCNTFAPNGVAATVEKRQFRHDRLVRSPGRSCSKRRGLKFAFCRKYCTSVPPDRTDATPPSNPQTLPYAAPFSHCCMRSPPSMCKSLD